VARYDGAVHGADVALAAVVTPDGATVIVTGYSANTNPDFFDYATVAYDTATGARKWLARYHGPNGPNANASAYAAVVTPDGAAVIVTGSSRNATGGFDYATVAYDTATGARKWVARYDGGTAAKAIAVTPDGATVIVTGYTVTIAYDATTGAQKWVAGFGGDFADAVVVTPDAATVIVTGNSASSSSNYETVAYDTATGVQKWVADYNGPGHGEDDARAAVVTPDSATVIVTGGSFGKSSSFDYATVAYDAATGVQRWVARYDGPAHAADIANAAAVTPDGTSVIVTGDSQDAESSNDWETVAYNTASGAKQWSARHDAHEPDGAVARAVMLTPDGATVVVTGDSADPTGIDYRTIAYHL
jgi:hypothetical protein